MSEPTIIDAPDAPPPPAMEDADALRAALAAARRELAVAREERDALAAELQHRVRNVLAVVRSVFRRTAESGAAADQVVEHFEGRMNAVARYQLETVGGAATPVELEDIVRDELLPTRRLDGPGCTVAGPPVLLHADAVVPMALAIHELATNAIKFGALARAEAALHVDWSVEGAEASLVLRWTETGIAVLRTPPRLRGFGRQFVEEALPYQLGAAASFSFEPGRLLCTITLPARHFDAGERSDDRGALFAAATRERR